MATITLKGRHFVSGGEYSASVIYTKHYIVEHDESLWLYINDTGKSNSEPTATNPDWYLIREDSGSGGNNNNNKTFSVTNADSTAIPIFSAVSPTNNGDAVSVTANTGEEFILYGVTNTQISGLATGTITYNGYIEFTDADTNLAGVGIYMNTSDQTISFTSTPVDGLRRIGTVTQLVSGTYTAHITIHSKQLSTSTQNVGQSNYLDAGFGSAPYGTLYRWGHAPYGIANPSASFTSTTHNFNGVNYTSSMRSSLVTLSQVPAITITDAEKQVFKLTGHLSRVPNKILNRKFTSGTSKGSAICLFMKAFIEFYESTDNGVTYTLRQTLSYDLLRMLPVATESTSNSYEDSLASNRLDIPINMYIPPALRGFSDNSLMKILAYGYKSNTFVDGFGNNDRNINAFGYTPSPYSIAYPFINGAQYNFLESMRDYGERTNLKSGYDSVINNVFGAFQVLELPVSENDIQWF